MKDIVLAAAQITAKQMTSPIFQFMMITLFSGFNTILREVEITL